MQFTLEAALSVPLCLILLVIIVLAIVPIDDSTRRNTEAIAATLEEKVKLQKIDFNYLFEEGVSASDLRYLRASGQKAAEIVALLQDTKHLVLGGGE